MMETHVNDRSLFMSAPGSARLSRRRPRLLTAALILVAVSAVTAGALAVTAPNIITGGGGADAGTAAAATNLSPEPQSEPSAGGNAQLAETGALVVQRLALADTVAQSKWLSGKPIDDSEREQAVIDSAVAAAQKQGVDTALVTRFFRAQMDANKVVQHGLFARWMQEPGSAPTTAPDLAAIRPQLDAIGKAMVTALGKVTKVTTAPECHTVVNTERTKSAASLDALHGAGVDAAWATFCAT
ncbi:chorismate mutase [Rathayibacter toxicus]|uniref:chorismate mutase n=2 Tax=Rathayibacter toxicus TaxID=145458 RepID=A0A2S5Y9Q8_9MICO|nr:chorismate mutase [Rathayibacter toxicus]PPH58555.1 chorismate mutase [Rathayibacter toxicus]PPH61183.1 chorismate mutase [Rathayibacter toxicus]PPH89071.1 chorismate mutase [Rathayibacter toxicus]PPI16861.1 chorismate mutase [Rathayibacter toxicus]